MRTLQIIPILVLTAGLLAGLGHDAHASYLDPGSGSYLFQMAIAGVLGGFFTIREMLVRWRATREKQRETQQEE